MLSRNENNKLRLKSLDLEIFMGDLFEKCENEHEVEWLKEQIQGCAEKVVDERLEEVTA